MFSESIHRRVTRSLCLFTATVCSFAQSNLATLTGTVTDPSGAAAAAAAVHAVNEATGESYSGAANDHGVYVIPLIKPGTYSVDAELQGLKTYRRPHVVSTVYQLPVGKGKAFDPAIDGSRSRAQQVAQWFNTAAFAAPADYTFGNAGKTVGIGPGAIAMDMSLIRDFPIKEMHQIEFRGEALNFINNPNFANPNTSRGNAVFGRITSLAPGNQSRIIQLGIRYSF